MVIALYFFMKVLFLKRFKIQKENISSWWWHWHGGGVLYLDGCRKNRLYVFPLIWKNRYSNFKKNTV